MLHAYDKRVCTPYTRLCSVCRALVAFLVSVCVFRHENVYYAFDFIKLLILYLGFVIFGSIHADYSNFVSKILFNGVVNAVGGRCGIFNDLEGVERILS